MTTNQRDAQALTYLVGRLRAETHGAGEWDELGTYSVVSKLIGQNLATTVEQVVRHALDPEARTPGAIQRPFLPQTAPQRRSGPPKKAEECKLHPGQYPPPYCGPCATEDTPAYYDPDPKETPMSTGGAEMVRGLLRGGV